MLQIRARELKVYAVARRRFVFAPEGRGDELRVHLESHGIQAVVSHIQGVPSDRLELERAADVNSLQDILDRWRRDHDC